MNIVVKKGVITVYSDSIDLCSKFTCPIPSGDLQRRETVQVPGFIPPGEYTGEIKIVQDQNTLLCISFKIKAER